MNNHTGLEKITEIIQGLNEDLRRSKARTKLINLQRMKSALESFTEMDISTIFHMPMASKIRMLVNIEAAINDQERHIKWLESTGNKLNSTPEQDASIEKMYEAQRKDAEALGIMPFVND